MVSKRKEQRQEWPVLLKADSVLYLSKLPLRYRHCQDKSAVGWRRIKEGQLRLCEGLICLGGGFADEDQAGVGVDDVEFGHAVFAVEQVADVVAVFEVLDVLPEGMDAGDFDVDFRVIADEFHDLFVGSVLEMDGLVIALDDRIICGWPDDGESQDVPKEGDRFFHVGGGEHGADVFRNVGGRHAELLIGL